MTSRTLTRSNGTSALSAGTSGRSSYLDLLDAAWRAHLARRSSAAPTVISLFAGGGGSSLGYSMAGYREALAVEWDATAVETFRLNFPGVPVWQDDVAKLSVEKCLKLAGLKPGALDVLDGSPPCQGFSVSGKRRFADPRNQLFTEYVRLLRGLRPKVFVMENVSGLVKGKMLLVFAEIMRELKASGYKVSARLMNAAYFDVPQLRERIILIGVRKDLAVAPSHPRAQSRPISLGEACQGVDTRGPELKGALREAWGLMRPWNRAGQAFETMIGRPRSFATRKVDWRKPCSTIMKTANPGFGGLLHPEFPCLLSIPAIKRASSFPDAFTLKGSFTAQWGQLGNCVPPLFMRALAAHVRRETLRAAKA